MKNDMNLRLVDLARFHVGILESGGQNHGQMVEKFQKAVGGVAAGEPWCMAFVQYCLGLVSEVHGVKSKVYRSENCLEVWHNSPVTFRSSFPKVGSIVIWKHANSTAGHTGIVTEVRPDGEFLTVEGNTANGDGIVREGDGVYIRVRNVNAKTKMTLIGFIDPYKV